MSKAINDVKQLRQDQDLTQEDLALEMGVTRQTIIAIETGKYIPSLPLAMRLAKFFNKKVEDIFNYE